MLDDLVSRAIDIVQARLGGLYAWAYSLLDFIENPLWKGWVAVLALVAICLIIGWFFRKALPFLGVVVIAALSFIVGATKQWKYDRDKQKQRERQKPKPPPVSKQPPWHFP